MAATKHGQDKALNATFRRISNRGPHPYPFVRDEYRSHGGDLKKLSNLLLAYSERYSDKVRIFCKHGASLEGGAIKYHADIWVEVTR
jgi:hypothetical protein